MLSKCCTQYVSKFGKFSSGHRTGNISFHSNPKEGNAKECSNYHNYTHLSSVQFSSVAQSCPTLCDFMIAACQASLSITNSRSSLRLKSIESVMPSSPLILFHPLFLLPPIPPSIRVFSNQSTLHMRWPKYWSFSFSIIRCRVRLFI